MNYCEMSKDELNSLLSELRVKYDVYKNQGLNLMMTRGVPATAQLDMTEAILNCNDYIDEDGTDCRNYGNLTGLTGMKRIFAELLEVDATNIIIGGNSSLAMMHDTLVRHMLFGAPTVGKPWCKEEKVKFLCPVPGYDRHFSICEMLGIEMINIPMNSDGPDMDMIEKLVADDASIKGIWCVPKYSNPTGVTYSDDVVRRFANLKTKAEDFVIMWDNAYIAHDLYADGGDSLLNIVPEAEKAGNLNKVYMFASTSKVTLAGGGVAMMTSSPENIKKMTELMGFQTIGQDKMNQLRHIRFLKSADNFREVMKKHADILRPKFAKVLEKLDEELSDAGIASWSNPKGGYFINFVTMKGCADKIVKMAAEVGVKLTAPAGSAFPYKKDPDDCNIRLSPSFPTVEDLSKAMDVVCTCAKITSIEKLLSE